jgi:hypothetical protein
MRALKLTFNSLALLMLVLVLVLAGSCSGGGDDSTTPPTIPPPGGGDGEGGDNDDPDVVGGVGNFLPASGAFGDLRGIAASREFVYVADSTTLYCFDKRGNLRGQVAALENVQGVDVFPPSRGSEVDNDDLYLLANCPVISHDPVTNWGYGTVYSAGLDSAVTRPDANNPDPRRIDGIPNDARVVPPSTEGLVVTAVYDIKVDRYGSVYIIVDLDSPPTAPVPDFPRTLTVMSSFNDFEIESGGPLPIENDETGETEDNGFPGFHLTFGAAVGDFDLYNDSNDITPDEWVNLGTLGLDNLYPDRIAEPNFNIYVGAANFIRDYVGVAEMTVDPLTGLFPTYTISDSVENGFGYNRVIGGPSGGAPGSFSPFGSPEDPDLPEGGPAGMGLDPSNNNMYICDPGNGRIQVFDQTGQLQDVLSGFTAPSDVAVDDRGNVFVCDVNQFIPILRTLPDDAFGNIGGTVRNATIDAPIEGARVTLSNSDGTIFDQEFTNINGQYLFENVPIGNFFVGASRFNYNSDIPQQAIQVLKDRTVVANFNLTPVTGNTNGSYVGQIDDANSNLVLEGVLVRIVGTTISTISNDAGHFEIPNLPAGDYQVEFSKDGYVTITKDITILRSTTTTDNNLRMQRVP